MSRYLCVLTLDTPQRGPVTFKGVTTPTPESTRESVLDDLIAHVYQQARIPAALPPVVLHWSMEPDAL
jgi:hypothetical protein